MAISNHRPGSPEQGQGSAVCGDSHRALVLPFKLNANQYAQNVKFEICEHDQLLKSCSTLCHPRTIAHQAPLCMGFSKQEYWSRLPSPSPENLPDSGIEPESVALQEDSLPSESPGNPERLNMLK